jgi:hypothetical protein
VLTPALARVAARALDGVELSLRSVLVLLALDLLGVEPVRVAGAAGVAGRGQGLAAAGDLEPALGLREAGAGDAEGEDGPADEKTLH